MCSKRLVALLVPYISMLFFVMCSTKIQPVVIAIGGAPAEIDFWEKVVQQCRDKTGVDIELHRQPTDTDQRRQNLVTSLRAHKSTPDIFLMDVAWIAQFAASGWLAPLNVSNDTAMQLSSEDFFEPVVNSVDTWNNELIALPVYVDGGLLYYRKDLLQKYGFSAPSTWDELVSQARTIMEKENLTNKNFTGFVWQGAQYEGLVCTFLEFCGSNNGGIHIDTNSIINSTPNLEAVIFMDNLIHKYRISPPNTYTDMKEEEVRQVFQNGNALFERNWPYAWKLHEAPGSPVAGKVGIALLPHFDGGRSVSTLGGWHMGLSRYSKNKEKALSCMRYLLSPEVQKEFTLNLGWNPGRISVYDDPEVKEALPHLSILKEVFNHAIARPNVPYYSYMSNIIQRYVSSALAQKMNEKDALNKCENELKIIVKQYGNR